MALSAHVRNLHVINLPDAVSAEHDVWNKHLETAFVTVLAVELGDEEILITCGDEIADIFGRPYLFGSTRYLGIRVIRR